MVTIEIYQQYEESVSADTLITLVRDVFDLLDQPPDPSLSIKISDDEAIRALNHSFLGIDAPTDVLSFPLPFEDPESGLHYYGDIILSFPTASAQAEQGGHEIEEEIKLLIVHGILHLLGFDHATAEEKEKMWKTQTQLITALKIKAQPVE